MVEGGPRLIFHVAVAAEWLAARSTGEYDGTHAAYEEQLPWVLEHGFGGVREPLLVLAIDPARLRAPVRDVVDPGSGRAFPHVLGRINRDAVVEVRQVQDGPVGDDLHGAGATPPVPDRRPLRAIAGLLACIVAAVLIALLVAH